MLDKFFFSGDKWFKSFLLRHPTLKWRTTQELGYDRVKVTKEQLLCWFGELQGFLMVEVEDAATLITDPRRFFNCDESGFPLQAKKKRVLAKSGARNV